MRWQDGSRETFQGIPANRRITVSQGEGAPFEENIRLASPLLIDGLAPAKGEVAIPQPADLGLVEEKRLLKAVETAQKAVRNAPEDAEVWGQLGHLYLSHRWEVPAIACYRRANTLAPDEFRWLYFLGRLMARREPAAAAKYLNRALTLNDTYAPGTPLSRLCTPYFRKV